MTLKTISLIYRGRGTFTTRQKLSLHKGQSVRAYLGPTPVTDATRGAFKVSRALAKRLSIDPELDPLNSWRASILRMRLEAFPDGGRIFLDANVFLYHCWDQSQSCSWLIGRIETGLVHAATSTTVLGEVTHRLLIAEAVSRRPEIARHPVRFLKRHPEFVRSLSQTRLVVERLTQLPLHVVPLTPALWHRAVAISQEVGLLMNDAAIVASLQELRLNHLATADRDFRQVPGLMLWSP